MWTVPETNLACSRLQDSGESGSKKKVRKPAWGLGREREFPPAVFRSLAFSLLARFFRSSTLTESLAQAKTNLESGFKRMRFGWAVWTKGRFVKTYINYGVSFFSKLSVFLLVCYTAVADYILVGVTYDRSRSTATKAYKSNKFRWFRIFFYTTRPSRAPTQSHHSNPGHYAVSMSGSSKTTTFCSFLCRHRKTTTWKCLISRFMEVVTNPDRSSRLFLNLHIFLRNSTLRQFAYRLIKWASCGNRAVVHVEAILECKVTIQTAFARATRITDAG